jgi:ribulose-phosphate 3-epimerase
VTTVRSVDLARPHVVPSILSADFARLGDQVSQVMDEGARMIQVDVMDGLFVPPITMGALVVDALRDLVHERGGILDCHLMVARPERHLQAFVEAGADVITVHAEATPNVHYVLGQIRAAGCSTGIALNPGTPIVVVEPVVELLDLCLCMTVNPGWGGQPFIASSADRIAALRSLLPGEVALQVDGGISADTVASAAVAGANLLVAGSAVFGGPDPAAAYAELARLLEAAWAERPD